jgi:hypothetical protein
MNNFLSDKPIPPRERLIFGLIQWLKGQGKRVFADLQFFAVFGAG